MAAQKRRGTPRAKQRTTTSSTVGMRQYPTSRARTNRRGREKADRSVWVLLVAVVLALVVFVQMGRSLGVFGSLMGQGADGSSSSQAATLSERQNGTQEASESVTIKLVAIGDVIQHSGVFQSGLQSDGSYNFDHIFSHITGELEGQDIMVLNQETPLGGKDVGGYSGYPTFNGPQEMGDAEAKVGFNVVLKATNHALDRGYDGIHAELAFWQEKHPDVNVIGVRDVEAQDAMQQKTWCLYEKDGFKVALLNYTYGTNGIADPQGAVNLLDADAITSDVSAARDAGADLVVVFPHWGIEYQTTPTDEQRQWAQTMADAGVDLIIGGHPHVIEPVETITASDGHEVLCMWSLGNFVSTQNDNQSLVGGMAKVTLQKDADGTAKVASWSFVPLVTHKGTGDSMTTYLLRDYTDELAATNIFQTDNSSCTPAWCQEFCSEVLGENYDTQNSVLEGTLEDTTQAGTDDAGSSEELAEAA